MCCRLPHIQLCHVVKCYSYSTLLFLFLQDLASEVSLSGTAKKKKKVGGAGEAKGGAPTPPTPMKANNLQGQVLTPAQLQSLLAQVFIFIKYY